MATAYPDDLCPYHGKAGTRQSLEAPDFADSLGSLNRKGFLESVRKGRERQYTVLISEDEYLEVEASDFLKRHSGRSMGGFVKHSFLLTPFRKMNWMSCVVCSTKESRMEG